MNTWGAAATARTYDEVANTYADHFPGTEPEAAVDLAMIDHFVSLVRATHVGGEASGRETSGACAPRVLDAGCGTGRLLPYLAERGCAMEGIDLSPGMIRRAQNDHPEFLTTVGSLTALPHADHAFDGIFSWYSTIHSPDADVAVMLAECHRVLCPNGVLLVGFQTGDGVRDVGEGYRASGHDVELQRWSRSLDVMGTLLDEAGFTVVTRFERSPTPHERDGQGVVIAQRG